MFLMTFIQSKEIIYIRKFYWLNPKSDRKKRQNQHITPFKKYWFVLQFPQFSNGWGWAIQYNS